MCVLAYIWHRYAYGCSEMVFHPFYKWPTKGPFTPLIGTFLGSGMQLSSKISVFAYICSCKLEPSPPPGASTEQLW